MARTYEIAFELGARTTSGFRGAFSEADSSLSGLGKLAKVSGAAIAAAAATAAAALGTAAVAIAKTGMQYNMMAENSQVAWETLLGTQEKAKKMFDDIATFAKKTQFDTEQVDQMAKYMHNAGLEGQAMFDELTKVADVAGAFNIPADSANELARQMSQVRQANVAYTEDLNILQDRGVPIYKALSEQMGVTVADVRKMASEGKINADIYNAAFDSIAQSVAGSSAKQANTMSGMLSTLQDNLKAISGSLTEELFNKTKGTLQKVMPIIENFSSALKEGGLKAAIESVLPDSTVKRFLAFGDAAGKAINGIKSFANAYVTYIKNLFSGEGNLGESFARIFNAIKTIAVPILQDAIVFIKSIIGQIKQFWDENGAQIVQAVKNVFKIIASIIEFISPVILFIVKTVWENVKGVIQGALNIIMGVIKVFSGLFTGDFSKMWEGIKQLFSGAVTFIWNLVNLLFIGKLLGGVKSLASGLVSTLKSGWDNVILGIKNFIAPAKSLFDDIVKSVKANFDDIVAAAKQLPGKIGQGIKDFAKDAWEGIKGLADGLITKFKEALGINSPSTVFYDMAKWIVKGLTNGLGAENLKSLGMKAFSGFAGGALNTFESIKGFFTGGPIPDAGSGVQRWAGIAAQALQMTGQYSEANLKRMLYQMQTESGGSPNAVNNWDSNAKRGTPSKGLMQVIDPTFKSNAMPGYNTNVYDPLSNMLASIRYSVARYGSLEKAWKGHGYATGGVVSSPELAMVGEGKSTESIIPWNNSARSFALWAMTGRRIGAFGRGQSPLAVKRPLSSGNGASITIENKPTIIVQASNVQNGEIERQLNNSNKSFLRQLKEVMRDEERLSFG